MSSHSILMTLDTFLLMAENFLVSSHISLRELSHAEGQRFCTRNILWRLTFRDGGGGKVVDFSITTFSGVKKHRYF